MNRDELERRYGPQPDEPSFRGRYRLLQSWYRVEVLKQEAFGRHCPGGTLVGSCLVDGESTGANLMSLAARACAYEKLAEKENYNPDLTVDRYRLFNNMLSSQPMCLNLFADLRLGVRQECANAGQVLMSMFAQSPTAAVERVEIEMLPQPRRDYIRDKTAFDAAVLFIDANGRRKLASIETKYTDKLGENSAREEDYQKQLAGDLEIFNDEGQCWYAGHSFDQIVRNLLLTLIYAERHALSCATNYVLAPESDSETADRVAVIKGRLSDRYRDCIVLLPLETVVQRGLTVADPFFTEHLRRFHRRYLDLSQIEHLCSE